MIQRTSTIKRVALDVEESDCAPFTSWPDIDGGITCTDCTALVLSKPYDGRCDKYCASFGHVCVAAAEEKDESCEVLESKRCDEEIKGTSDMLCTCEYGDTAPPPSPAPAESACFGELPALAADQGKEVGMLHTSSAADCKEACRGNADCQSVSFCPVWHGCWLKSRSMSADEPTTPLEDCKTFYKQPCDGAVIPTPSPAPTRPPAGSPKIKVASYNLFWWHAFGEHPWKGRKITDNIRDTLKPDVLGLQECDSPTTIQRRTGYIPASDFAGAQGVMVKQGLFEVGSSGSRDLQATGKWGPRYVTWVRLTHKQSGRAFWHFNTHWCVASGNGRTCSADKRYAGAKNMLLAIQELARNEPVIITGDFNAAMDEPGPQHFLRNGFSLAISSWVDAVYYSTQHWRKGATKTGEHAESDHRPVVAELELI